MAAGGILLPGIIFCLLLLCGGVAFPCQGATPTRVIYVEGGEYPDYTSVLLGLASGLQQGGLVGGAPQKNVTPPLSALEL